MNYHPLTREIPNLIKANNLWFETFEHDPVITSEEAAKVRTGGYTMKQGAKALILRVKINGQKKFVMVVVPGDKRFDKVKLEKIIGTKDIRFATADEIKSVTNGIEIGGIPPFGQLFGLEVYADSSITENEKIIFNAGDRSFSVAMYAKDYLKLVKPVVVEVV